MLNENTKLNVNGKMVLNSKNTEVNVNGLDLVTNMYGQTQLNSDNCAVSVKQADKDFTTITVRIQGGNTFCINVLHGESDVTIHTHSTAPVTKKTEKLSAKCNYTSIRKGNSELVTIFNDID